MKFEYKVDRDVGLNLPAPGGSSNCWIGIVLFLIALLAFSGFLYAKGFVVTESVSSQLKKVIANEEKKLLDQQVKLTALEQKLIAMNREKQIQATTNRELNKKLLSVEDELTEAKEKLLLYKNILAPETEKQGLMIRHFGMRKKVLGSKEKRYHYQIVLYQARGGKKVLKGQYVIRIAGMKDNKRVSYTHRELAADGLEAKRKFALKHYQSLEGDIIIPEDFEPRKVTLWIIPDNKSMSTQSQSYQWDVLAK
jgi:hypothetical protein